MEVCEEYITYKHMKNNIKTEACEKYIMRRHTKNNMKTKT